MAMQAGGEAALSGKSSATCLQTRGAYFRLQAAGRQRGASHHGMLRGEKAKSVRCWPNKPPQSVEIRHVNQVGQSILWTGYTAFQDRKCAAADLKQNRTRGTAVVAATAAPERYSSAGVPHYPVAAGPQNMDGFVDGGSGGAHAAGWHERGAARSAV